MRGNITVCVKKRYSRVSFCDGLFYDDSLLRPLSSRTEYSRIVVRQCRDSSILSLFSAFLVLFRCACVSFFFFHFSAILLSWLWFFHPWRPSKRQKRRKNQNSWRYILSWCLLNYSLGLLQQNKKWFDWGSCTLHFGLYYELIYQLDASIYLCTISSTCLGLTRPSSGAMDVIIYLHIQHMVSLV